MDEIRDVIDPSHTIIGKIFDGKKYIFEVLPELTSFIREFGEKLSDAHFIRRGADIWISRSATVAPTASLTGPLIIDEGAEIRHCAFIRGSVVIGKNAVVGNSTEVKNSILFDGVQAPHYNYIGDSILGYKSHMGAGSITSNVKSDKTTIYISYGRERIQTGLKKFGAILGDYVEIGCGCVLNPGTMIARHTNIYPLSSVRGFVPENSIYKSNGTAKIVNKIGIGKNNT